MSKKNRLKTDEQPAKKTSKKKKGSAAKNLLNFEWKNQKVAKILGLTLVCLSGLLLLAMFSYVFTFRSDQSQVMFRGVETLTDQGIEVNNLLSRFGAVVAHFFIHNLFGLASFILVSIFLATGINLSFQKNVLPVKKYLTNALLLMIGSSAILAYVQGVGFPNSALSLGGAFGNSISGANGWMTNFISPVGTGVVFFFMFLGITTWKFDLDFQKLLPNKGKKGKASEEEDADLDGPAIVSMDDSLFEKDNIELESETQEAPQAEQEVKQESKEAEETAQTLEEESLKKEKEETTSENEPPPATSDDEFEVVENAKPETAPEENDLELTVEKPVEEKAADHIEHKDKFDPTLDLSNFKFPGLDLLEEHGDGQVKMDAEELQRNKDQIVATLNNYKIEISKIKATIGPTVTLYEIVPAPGVRISKIKNLEDDIALSLAALGIRIIAPIPGKGTIGIEVPNATKEVVSMRSLIASEKFANSKMELPVVLGKSISNEIFVYDLAKMPHLLMAGATGQGKSVGINSLIVSLLYKKHPSQLKFILVDPKKVELSIYNAIEKHYLAKLPGEEEAIITDTQKVIATLNSLCIEMDERYDLLKTAGCRNIKEYNKKYVDRRLNPKNGHKFMPYIVLVIDEFADLIMTAGKEVETPIARLAQLARAIGIHLILATQRPSVNIITGVIKANFPARISFKVTSKVDSRTILDTGGADQLIGRGDMLFSTGADLLRLQCGFVDTPEVDAITNFIEEQQGYMEAFMLPEYVSDTEEREGGSYGIDDLDELFEDAAHLIVSNQMGSTSLIQRRMKLGYNRAGRLMDQLEDAGIVGPNAGSKARDVLIATEAELEQFLEQYMKSKTE